MSENDKLPLHTKIGFRVTVLLLLLLTVFLLRNCADSIKYGTETGEEQMRQYYSLGYSEGVRQATGGQHTEEMEIENLLLRKVYLKGYREGWDSVQKADGERGFQDESE